MTIAEAGKRIGVSASFALRLVDREVLGPVDPLGRLARPHVLAYDQRRRARLSAVAEVTAANVASAVPYR
ncbi:MAG: hypothetical protein JJU45_11900 [Acidimicrobiia bacterium]|nr:hypothetical protein [Acidimicrobiia bacterium]